MANLKAGTTIGGKLVWSASNLPLTPKTDTIEYMGHKIYSTHDKPTLLELGAASLAYTNTELGKKVDKVAGKALSDKNFTLAYENKLIDIAAGAQVNVPTNLSYTTDTIKGTLNSTTGNSVSIDGVTITKAGLISSVDKVKLDSLPSGNSGIIPITGGGTGSNTQAGARTALQLGNHVTHNYGTAINTVMQGNDARVLAAATNADLVSGLALKSDKTITLTAGTGLSGGGDLTANRTFSVNYGTAAGTAAQGNDSRINNGQAAFVRLNIGATAETARTALQLGNHVTHNYGTTNNSVMQGNDARVLAAATKTELTNGLATKAAASHTHPWAQVTGQPATATRWPTWAEVSSKPVGAADPWPVGACYTQYPATPAPATLFGGTWKLLFNTEGVFFRTEGGGASIFEGGIQGDDNKSHTHTASTNSTGAHTHTTSGTAASAGAHTHTLSGTAASAGAHTHTFTSIKQGQGDDHRTSGVSARGSSEGSFTVTTSSAGAHTHSISGTAASSGAHTHTVSGTAASAGGHAHTVTVAASGGTEVRPINRTIRVWQRTA